MQAQSTWPPDHACCFVISSLQIIWSCSVSIICSRPLMMSLRSCQPVHALLRSADTSMAIRWRLCNYIPAGRQAGCEHTGNKQQTNGSMLASTAGPSTGPQCLTQAADNMEVDRIRFKHVVYDISPLLPKPRGWRGSCRLRVQKPREGVPHSRLAVPDRRHRVRWDDHVKVLRQDCSQPFP